MVVTSGMEPTSVIVIPPEKGKCPITSTMRKGVFTNGPSGQNVRVTKYTAQMVVCVYPNRTERNSTR